MHVNTCLDPLNFFSVYSMFGDSVWWSQNLCSICKYLYVKSVSSQSYGEGTIYRKISIFENNQIPVILYRGKVEKIEDTCST